MAFSTVKYVIWMLLEVEADIRIKFGAQNTFVVACYTFIC